MDDDSSGLAVALGPGVGQGIASGRYIDGNSRQSEVADGLRGARPPSPAPASCFSVMSMVAASPPASASCRVTMAAVPGSSALSCITAELLDSMLV